jgi:outer membrane protein assembly factor BamA
VGWDLFGFAPTVLALRLDAGVETTDALPGFTVGGSSGAVGIATVDIGLPGRASAYPIRGYPAGVQRGNRVASGSAEYRFPLLLVERGYRLFPLAIERIWGDVFADVGTAWCTGGCGASTGTRPRPLASAGAEVVLDLKVGYGATVPFRSGVALPLDRSWREHPQFYARVGVSF